MKKGILYIVLLIWLLVIFMFSNQKGDESTSSSSKIVDICITMYEKISNTKLDINTNKKTYEYLSHIVRKLAHVTIYFILGIIICNIILLYNLESKKIILLSILFCFVYAMSDEIHQLFIDGRAGSIFDVLIDTCGSILGILLSYKITNSKKNV